MAESDETESVDIEADIFWDRVATHREIMFGIKSDGSIRSICTNIEIISEVEIKKEVLERCAEHFNNDIGCFHEFLTEDQETEYIWVVKTKKNNYMVIELEDEEEIDKRAIEDEINCQLRAEDSPNWKLYFTYVGCEPTFCEDSEKFPHIYQLIFVFSTGTLDEFSCALICDLFLNILDCALKDVPFINYHHLKMYDIGSKVKEKIDLAMINIQHNKEYHKNVGEIFRNMLDTPCSSFDFKEREFENKNTQFRTMQCLFSYNDTKRFLNICKTKDVGIYAVFIVIINNILLRHARKNGFKGLLYTRALHIVNVRFLLKHDKKYVYKLGSHSLPYMQIFKLESIAVEDILKQVPSVETHMEKIVTGNYFFNQEAFTELFIGQSGDKCSPGKWNPHYCFSVTNMGNLDNFYSPDNPNNKFQVLSYERASPAIEGGHLDVNFHIFKGKLNVHFDFSNKYFSDTEMFNLIGTFTQVFRSIK